MSFNITIGYEVKNCISCPYHNREQGGVMYCNLGKTPEERYIITRDNLHEFPEKCPLNKPKESEIAGKYIVIYLNDTGKYEIKIGFIKFKAAYDYCKSIAKDRKPKMYELVEYI